MRIKLDDSINKKLCFFFLFKNPIAFRDHFLPQAWGKPYITRYYQIPLALVHDALVCSGRSWGKSIDLEASAAQAAINEYNSESLITSFRRTHIKDRCEAIINYFERVPYFRHFLHPHARTSKQAINRTPIYEIRFANGHVLWGISVGDDPLAVNIQGKHPKFRYMEEAQSYPMTAWQKFQGTADPKGTIDKFVGVPDGRTDTPFRSMDTKLERFDNKRFHISRTADPWFNHEMKNNLVETYGKEDADEYLQQVHGEWGHPSWGYWDIDQIQRNVNGTNFCKVITISKKDFEGILPEQAISELVSEDYKDCILGIDAGFTEPTVVTPFFHNGERWDYKYRINLTDRMIYTDQAKIIDAIATKLRASSLGIDCTSGDGRALATELQNPKIEEYAKKDYRNRVIWVQFNSKVIYGRNADGSEKKEETKIFSSNKLHSWFSKKWFNLYYDEDLISEFNSESQHKTDSGEMRIKTPQNVHIPESFRCFIVAWFSRHGEFVIDEPEEYGSFVLPSWKNAMASYGSEYIEESDEKIKEINKLRRIN